MSTAERESGNRLKHSFLLAKPDFQLNYLDNIRSGAIEQLATHAACLGIPLYERGYGDDPSLIAKEAL